MDIAIRYFAGCPNWEIAFSRLRQVLRESGLDERIDLQVVGSQEEAERLAFVGSPTILIDGRDPFLPEGRHSYGLSCRVFETESALEGSPSAQQLREAIAAAVG